MAIVTYTPDEIQDSGILSKQQFTSGITYSFTITNKDIPGSCYFTIEALLHNSSLPMFFDGSSYENLLNITSITADIFGNHFAAVIEPQGTSSFDWTPAITIPLGEVYLKATGNIGVSVENLP